MSKVEYPFKRVAVAAHPQLAEAIRLSDQIANALREDGLQITRGLLYDDDLRRCIYEHQVDLLIALGGDGTMLRAGHLCGPVGVPILGINVGRFGFLMEIKQTKWQETLPHLAAGEYWLEKRMMLNATRWHDNECLGQWEVLNEVVVSRGQMVRPVHLVTHVDGRHLTTYVADALIAATATGSTAYALAAGGPILPPELRTILLVPVAPHLSIDRAIVLAEGSSVSIIVHTDHQAVLSPDGQLPIDLIEGDRVDVRASDHTVQFIRFQDPGYFYRNLTPHMSRNPSTGER
jgi:NAD+ kinase